MADFGNLVGFGQLERLSGIKPAQPLRVLSYIGKSKSETQTQDHVVRVYPAPYEPALTFAGHFEFGLKYEEIHLEFFSRLFQTIDPIELVNWINSNPSGQYARRAGFLFEWLTGGRLELADRPPVNYIDVLDPAEYFTSTHAPNNRRWRVRENLPGTPAFCPLIRMTPELKAAAAFNTKTELEKLDIEFGADLLLRCASWLTLKESQASFLIEKEADKADRIKRFAHVIAEHSGRIKDPLSVKSLETLQLGILGENALRKGMRRSPIFVGQDTMYKQIVHYVAPRYEDMAAMLHGLQEFDDATVFANPLVRAATIAFAFVYIHPMRDGNGRIHRFLINDVLQRDEAITKGVILPVSATITNSMQERTDYDRVLEEFSKPFMERYRDSYRFGDEYVAEDGTPTNFYFDAYEDASHAWRYPDLTRHSVYTAELIAKTIQREMVNEARILVRFDHATNRLKNWIEMPNRDATRIIRAIHDNHWQVSHKLQGEYEFLRDPAMQLRIVEAVQSAFQDREEIEIVESARDGDAAQTPREAT